jgi:murein L,D-transpeptidase YcbB/YkuD
MRLFTFIALIIAALDSSIVVANNESTAETDIHIQYPLLVNTFYQQQQHSLFWFADDIYHEHLREALMCSVNAAYQSGLDSSKYHIGQLRQFHDHIPVDEVILEKADHVFTDAAIALCKDLYQGEDIARWLSYDGISGKYAKADDEYILKGLASVIDASELSNFINSLEPRGMNYQLLKRELQDCHSDSNHLRARQLTSSMNYFRWITHFHLDSFIVVNIGSATLRYYVHDSLVLGMRAVLGSPDTKTPRFAAYCKEVTLYPYWNMPRSIAVNEWLPAFKRNPRLLKFLNMEVINRAGKTIDPDAINWSQVNVHQFPYRIRQKTGCLNPMGVVKFTLTSPFDVYMHDTNFKGVFQSKNRYYSHGCIRIQEPAALANALLVDRVDTAFLAGCYKDQLPTVLPIANPVPVFVVYLTAEVSEDGHIEYYRDIYHILK